MYEAKLQSKYLIMECRMGNEKLSETDKWKQKLFFSFISSFLWNHSVVWIQNIKMRNAIFIFFLLLELEIIRIKMYAFFMISLSLFYRHNATIHKIQMFLLRVNFIKNQRNLEFSTLFLWKLLLTTQFFYK